MQNIITPKKKNPRRLAVDFVYSLKGPSNYFDGPFTIHSLIAFRFRVIGQNVLMVSPNH